MKSLILDYNNICNDYIFKFLKDKPLHYIKLKTMEIDNNFAIKDNNYTCKLIINTKLLGPKPNKNTFIIPEYLEFIISYNTNIEKLIDNINDILNCNKFNTKDKDFYNKGIYFELSDSNIIIHNLSNHYIITLIITTDYEDNNNNILKNYIGFVKDEYVILSNNNIKITHAYNMVNDSVYININNYYNIVTTASNRFAKLILNKDNTKYYNNIDYIYVYDTPTILDNIVISFNTAYHMDLVYNNNYNIIFEIGIDNIIYNKVSELSNNLVNYFHTIDKINTRLDVLDINYNSINTTNNISNNINSNNYNSIIDTINKLNDENIKLNNNIDILKNCIYPIIHNKKFIELALDKSNIYSGEPVDYHSDNHINNIKIDVESSTLECVNKKTKINIVKKKSNKHMLFPMTNVNLVLDNKNLHFNY